MARSVSEWIAKHDDEAIPPRVKLRVFQRADKRGTSCTLLIVGKLRPEYDHICALVNGGRHRESNIQLLCSESHKGKTKADVAEKSQTYHKQLAAAGIRKPPRLKGQGFRKAGKQHSATRPVTRKNSTLARQQESVSAALNAEAST